MARFGAEKNATTGRKHVQVIVSIVACMPILSYGTAMGWISPYRALLMGNTSPSSPPLTESDISWMASVLYFPAPFAVFLYGSAADRFGRKMALYGCGLFFVIGWTMKIFWCNAVGLICARALIGFGTGGATVVCPLYVKEVSDDAIRGTTGIFIGLSITLGSLLIFTIGDLLPFYPVLWMMLSIAAGNLCLLMWLPESPAYLVECGRIEEAAKALGLLRSLSSDDASIQTEIERLKKEQGSAPPKFSPKVLFADKTTTKAFFVALTVGLAREFCGCLAIVVYGSDMFEVASRASGVRCSSNKQSTVVAAAQVAGSLLSTQLVDRAGRKPLLISSSLIAGCSMCLLGTWFLLAQHSILLPNWIPMVGLCITIFADAAGLQPLPYVIMTEMSSFQARSTMATVILVISFLADFAILKIFAQIVLLIGYHYTFYVFSVIVFLYMIFVIFLVPETKMRYLEEIHEELNGLWTFRTASTKM